MLLGILLAAVVFFYRREQRAGVSPRVRAFLAGVRCSILVLLAAVWLEPLVATYIQRRIESQTLVLVDGSASMSLKDRYPVPANAELAAKVLAGVADPKAITRAELADRLLTRDQQVLLRELAAENPVRIYQFGDKLNYVGQVQQGGEERESGGAGEREKERGRDGEMERRRETNLASPGSQPAGNDDLQSVLVQALRR